MTKPKLEKCSPPSLEELTKEQKEKKRSEWVIECMKEKVELGKFYKHVNGLTQGFSDLHDAIEDAYGEQLAGSEASDIEPAV